MNRQTLHSTTEVGPYRIRGVEVVRAEVGESVIRVFRQRVQAVAYEPATGAVELAPISVRHALLIQRMEARVRRYQVEQFGLLVMRAPASRGEAHFHFIFWLHPSKPEILLVRVVRSSAWREWPKAWRMLCNPLAWRFGRAAWVMRRAYARLLSSDNYVPSGNRQSGNA